MPAWTEEHGSGYGDDRRSTAGGGASRAAKHGAVAVLVRSVTARSLRTPHTGAMRYDDDAAEDPGRRGHRRGRRAARPARRARARSPCACASTSQTLPDVESANVIGELRGREKPDEIVVIGAHIDSWDVGQGAHDDGAGCVTMMQALHAAQAARPPRRAARSASCCSRTRRTALRGGKAYARAARGRARASTCSRSRPTAAASRRAASASSDKDPEARQRACARASATSRRCSRALGASRGRRRATVAPTSGRWSPAGVPQVGLDVDEPHVLRLSTTPRPTRSTRSMPRDLADDGRRGRGARVRRRRHARPPRRAVTRRAR